MNTLPSQPRVLVTGASGFVGRYCLAALAQQQIEVHGLGRKEPGSDLPVIWHSQDLHDSAGTEKLLKDLQPSHLLHLAWYAEPGKYLHASENLLWVQSSLALFQAFQRFGGQRILSAGSCLEYDLQAGFCSELTTARKSSHLYGNCKHALHLMGEAWGRQMGISFAWAHLFYLYGPGEAPNRLVPAVFNAILAGETIKCSHGRQIKDFLHVQDVAEALVAVLLSDMQGAVNIGSGQPLSVRDLVLKQIAVSGQQAEVDFGAYPSSPFDPPFMVANTERLSQELSWQPKISLENGLYHLYQTLKSGQIQ
ncbi:MAG: NAD-dependent epimerase/dehydratase [Candidatus Sericytochromatia bacterium]|nr:NAD-dependent epimerase/dehydratase [Candidatus Sericytochromatia bacterium]